MCSRVTHQSRVCVPLTAKLITIPSNTQVEVPLLARRPTPAVVHNRAVEFGTVCDEKKAFGAVSLVNKGSRKAAFSVTWDKALPLAFTPSEVRGCRTGNAGYLAS